MAASSGSRHRADVQGLRALAVVLVIAAHAGVPFLDGGFVGVDVFFVISGFLITGLLVREVEAEGRLSLAGFWSRRARRILPAATLVLVVTLAAALVWLPLVNARDLVDDAVWSGLFAANLHFAGEGVSYFAEGTGPSPLQHYWSLAVEEQFYVVWPLLVLALAALAGRAGRPGLTRRALLVVLVVVSGASLAWSLVSTAADPAAAYFSTPARVWELGVGAVLALVLPRLAPRVPRLLSWLLALAGLGAIGVASVALSPATPFPGAAALLPVLGAAALVAAGSTSAGHPAPVRWLLTCRPARVLGDWSFSLYLWHWPALVITEQHLGRALTVTERLVTVLVVLNLAALTYRFVETPFRSGRLSVRLPSPRPLVLYPASLVLVVGAASGSWHYTEWRGGEGGDNPAIQVQGERDHHDETVALVKASVRAARQEVAIPSNLTPDLLDLRQSIADVGECDYENDVRRLCVRGDATGDRTVVVIGDSHARAWIPAMERITLDSGWRAFYLVKPQCPAGHVSVAPLKESVVFTGCDEFQDWVTDQVAALSPDLVVVSSSPPVNGVWVEGRRVLTIEKIAPELERGYDELFDELRDHAGRVVVIKDVPKSATDPGECLTSATPSLGSCMFEPVERSTILGDIVVKSALLAGADVVDPTPWLCFEGDCPVVVGGTLTYRDTDHLTTEYAAGLAGSLGRALRMTD
ncbi:peptidoglycan/LPS O-acetylase OafA/YrhL [Nocardioides marinisabuli]|uniref:Peptidoglycan/LPS O-acetylase OafA/YrhL n=1 Tax=Nocardioides marinisabuli TaxID=419476 RepID=A0A7Y9EZX1_9ACTN|nr:acyltransferase family protein [Nocardioides marinisabuli]NYD56135.1 peptidoglycan/LPS O-acetylase OafA/YrhL [Nocardioides marinisabuli]